MHNSRLFSVCWLGFVLCPAMIFAQAQPSAPSAVAIVPNPKTPAEFFARARQLSDLEAAGIPFHLKATYVASGNAEFTGNGTYEEWWKSKDDWRIEATLGSFKHVAIPDRSYSNSEYVPLRLQQAMHAILIDVPVSMEIRSRDWKVRKKKMAGIDLTVLSKTHHCALASTDPRTDRCEQQYYFTTEGLLRISFRDNTEIFFNKFEQFNNVLVPRKIEVSAGESPFLTIAIDEIEPIGTSAKALTNLTSAPQDLKPDENPIHSDGRVTAGRLIHQTAPSYPVEAIKKRMQGTVVLRATIDKTGDVRELQVVQSAGQLLDDAAMQVVRNWQYSPVVYQGKPVSVDTTISVVFRLSR